MDPISATSTFVVKVKNQRFTDIAAEEHKILLRTEGYELKPSVSLEKAMQPFVSLMSELSS